MKHSRLPLLALLAASAAGASARGDQDCAPAVPADWQPLAYPDAAAHAPTPRPDRVVLTWCDDPATTQAATWRTDTSVQRAVAEIAVAHEHGRGLVATRLEAATTHLATDLGEVHYHTVVFRNLAPDTLHAYRVGDGANWSEWFHFRTASREPRRFSFIYFGDAQNEIRTHWSRVFREAFREAPRAAFTLHAGDLINDGHNDAQWGEWFGAPAWVNATIPVVPSPGNHEHRPLSPEEGAPRVLSRNWRPQFNLPLNGPADLPIVAETCYFLDYQGVRIISLDSNKEQEAQAAWLREVLANNPQRWTILTFHHPLFSPARDRDNASLRSVWKPVFDEFRVDLVLTGHDHTYARSGVVDPRLRVGDTNVTKGYNQVYDPEIGSVYVVSVSGPKMYDLTSGDWAVRTAEDTQLFQIITVDGDELRFEARTATNRLYDAFTLKKRAGRPNELIELLPRENRRPRADPATPTASSNPPQR